MSSHKGKYILLVLAALYVCSSTAASTAVAYKFCYTILNQSKEDTARCYDKPQSYIIDGRDPAILTYLCCLGYFGDVSKNYIQYLADEFLVFIAGQQSDTTLPDIALFARMCADGRFRQLTVSDFMYWLDRRTDTSCLNPGRQVRSNIDGQVRSNLNRHVRSNPDGHAQINNLATGT
ncbi:uncharacterized protein LOC131935545 [Physella acuta]|uniref:uncharacterized protein LOC131935545 n=1 Tax=Physella acuta TaxID=109671 RepID=UPI0027DD78AD|nr:uncharacterized protein LOC131935545 [Physella acuta]